METFKIRRENAKTPRDSIKIRTLVEKAIQHVATPSNAKAPAKGLRLSNFATSHPEMGRPIIDATGMVSRMVPSSASLRFNKILMFGILEVHDEKQIPERKKKTLNAIRCLFFNSISPQIHRKDNELVAGNVELASSCRDYFVTVSHAHPEVPTLSLHFNY